MAQSLKKINKEGSIEARLRKIHLKMDRECLCDLRHSATQAVWGKGSPQAKIVFIGEAPGKKEDLQGEPFIGAAGKFLDEMLASVGLKREAVYITNVVKYRPPNNRDPLPQEVSDCWEWLRLEIECIQPKLIVTLGRHALHRFIPEAVISQEHGKLFRRDVPGLGEWNFYVLYHPAAALYNGGLRETLKQDFRRIPEITQAIRK
ncbi:MAG: uracil-DNA glycosylase [Candidatus Moraniibacteriota bacterium]